jgi:hypothetical protein
MVSATAAFEMQSNPAIVSPPNNRRCDEGLSAQRYSACDLLMCVPGPEHPAAVRSDEKSKLCGRAAFRKREHYFLTLKTSSPPEGRR